MIVITISIVVYKKLRADIATHRQNFKIMKHLNAVVGKITF